MADYLTQLPICHRDKLIGGANPNPSPVHGAFPPSSAGSSPVIYGGDENDGLGSPRRQRRGYYRRPGPPATPLKGAKHEATTCSGYWSELDSQNEE